MPEIAALIYLSCTCTLHVVLNRVLESKWSTHNERRAVSGRPLRCLFSPLSFGIKFVLELPAAVAGEEA